MDTIADFAPFTDEEMAGFAGAGLAWVASDEDDVPVGYLLAEVVDGCLYIEQVSVHPRAARRASAGSSSTTPRPASTLPWS
jgi:hypothetical protein